MQLKKNYFLLVIVITVFLLFSVTDIESSPASADNTIRQVIKITGDYPADVSSFDVIIDPPLRDISKSFVFMTFEHTGEDDHSDTFRSWEILDENTLRVYGESTATGNNAETFLATVVEYTEDSDITVQHGSFTITASLPEGEKTFSISAVNMTRSMLINNGQNHNADETTIGDEEFDRLRIVDSTHIGWLVGDTPNTGNQINRYSVVDWGDDRVTVERGINSFSGTTLTVTPSTTFDRTRTLLLATYALTTVIDETVDHSMVRATLNADATPKIVFNRVAGTTSTIETAWQLVQLPADELKVSYYNVVGTGGSGTTSITAVKDMDKSMVISPVCVPFGCSSSSSTSTVAGAIDRAQFYLQLRHNTSMYRERGDSTGTSNLDFEVVEFLEKDFAENPQGTNNLRQIVKIQGTFTAGNDFQDYSISPPLLDPSKAIVFLSSAQNYPSSGLETGEIAKNWEIINSTTFRISGSNNPALTNIQMTFNAVIVEFDSSSPFFKQNDRFQYSRNMVTSPKILHMSPVNLTDTMLISNGLGISGTDPTIGQEEFASVRLLTSTTWEYLVELFQNEVEHNEIVSIADWNQNDIFVQRGQATLTGTGVTVIPPVAIDRSRTLVFATHIGSGADYDQEPDDGGVLVTLDGSNHIVMERTDGTANDQIVNWQLIEFPTNFATVQHGIINQTGGTGNSTSSITAVGNLTRSFAVGTEGTLFGYGMGKGSSTDPNEMGQVSARIRLQDASTVRAFRADSTGSFDAGFQAIEFLESGATYDQSVTDTTTTSDNVNFDINKTAIDFSEIVDLATDNEINFTGTDVVQTIDLVGLSGVFVVNLNDDGTTSDVIHFNVTKLFNDVVPVIDLTHIDITKLLTDSASISDGVLTNITTVYGEGILDTVSQTDLVILNITKQNRDTVNVSDTVDITRILSLLLNDTASVNDPSILLTIHSVIPAGTGAPSSDSGGLPTFQRIVGLAITSEHFYVQAKDVVPSDFIINTFGNGESFSLVYIEASQPYQSWFQFSSFPDLLDFDTTVDNSRTVSDPARYKNMALDDFVLKVPEIACSDVDPFETPVQCLDQVVYEVPLLFTFKKGGVEFKEKHIVIIDAITPEKTCDPICQLVAFMTDNYWWLAGILIMFMIMYFGASAIKSRGVRTVRRVNKSHFTSFEVHGKPVRRKFKKGKR